MDDNTDNRPFYLTVAAVTGALAIVLAACATTGTTASKVGADGALFCAFQAKGGGTVVVGLVDAAAAMTPFGAPVVLAAGASKAFVDAACALAGPGGFPVSPPAVAPPQVAIVPPKA